MNSLKVCYYKTIFLQIKRGNNRGVFSNAKPIFIISIFDCIEDKIFTENKINLSPDGIVPIYKDNYQKYAPLENITPVYMPFFHLSSEEYWHIKWKGGYKPTTHAHTPSAKYLRENIEYAHLDNALWDLLQDGNVRTVLRETVVNHFLKNTNNK
jgi:putative restriction endonuclease